MIVLFTLMCMFVHFVLLSVLSCRAKTIKISTIILISVMGGGGGGGGELWNKVIVCLSV